MEVLKENYHDLFPTIQKAIEGADFIAFDTELTGLNERIERIKSFDDPQSRYAKVRIAATKFLIIQFGICTYTYLESENTFVAKPFNFYIFPANSDRKDYHDVCFMSSGSSLHFLSNCGFDFNKLIAHGIPFLNKTDEKRLLVRREDIEKRQHDNPPDDDTRIFVEKAISTIDTWLYDTKEEQLVVETPSMKQKRLIFQEYRKKFNGLASAESRPKSILFSRMTEVQKEKKLMEDAADALSASINFRSIIELLVACKKPMVGHNCFLDLCQLTHQFWEDIPEKLKEWKELVHKLFEVVIDTKHLASTHRRLRELIPKNGVQSILQIVQTQHFEEVSPKIVLDPKFTYYKLNDESRNHEAGYDAYITGYNFIRLAVFLLHEKDVIANALNEPSEISDDPMEQEQEQEQAQVQEHEPVEEDMNLITKLFQTERLTRFYNKLHLLRSDFKYISLDGEDGYPSPKHNGFLLSNIPASCSQAILNTVFGEFGTIFFQWIDDTHCWLTVKDDKKVSKVAQGLLRKAKFFSAYLEGGKKYKIAQEKNITQEIGDINIQSWNSWIKAIQDAYLENNLEEQDQDSDEIIDGVNDVPDVAEVTNVENVKFEFGNKFAALKDDDSSWPNSGWGDSGGFEENTEDTQGNWGSTDDSDTVNDSDILSTKRTLSPNISTNDDNNNDDIIDDVNTSNATKKTKLGAIGFLRSLFSET